jgi:hypothetical protein
MGQFWSTTQTEGLFGFVLPTFDDLIFQLYSAIALIDIRCGAYHIIILLYKFNEWCKPLIPICVRRFGYDHHLLVMLTREQHDMKK